MAHTNTALMIITQSQRMANYVKIYSDKQPLLALLPVIYSVL